MSVSPTGYYITTPTPAVGSALFNGDIAANAGQYGVLAKTSGQSNGAAIAAAAAVPRTRDGISAIFADANLQHLNGSKITIVNDSAVSTKESFQPYNSSLAEFNTEDEYSKQFENIIKNHTEQSTSKQTQKNGGSGGNLTTAEDILLNSGGVATQFYIASITIVGLYVFYRVYTTGMHPR